MRPIKLTIQGLNNFQNAQVIDFAKLTEKGLFGIFGATGSGKSTILDAITFALYGEVARKSSNYININCSCATVSFEFAIAKTTYIIDRTIQRKNNSTSCRLIELIDSNPKVLADKVRDVNLACKNIIGLSFEDFSRTVVLPQGKFSEFFRLKGADRREMLERLFGLEKYGHRLSEKIKSRLDASQRNYSIVQRQLVDYEDATEENYAATKQALDAATANCISLKASAAAAMKTYSDYQEIWNNQLKLTEWLQKKDALDAQNEVINANAARLQKANMADKVYPSMMAAERVEVKLKAQLILKRDFDLQLEILKTTQATTEATYQDLLTQKNVDVPALNEQRININKLEQAKTKLDATIFEIDQLDDKKAEYLRAKDLTAKDMAAVEIAIAELDATIKSDESALATLAIDVDTKEAIRQGYELSGQYKQAAADVEDKRNRTADIYATVKNLTAQKNQLLERGISAKAACDAATKNLTALQTEQMSAKIRLTLAAGAPCPVCGSVEHVAVKTSDTVEVLAIRELEDKKIVAEDLRNELRAKYKSASDRLVDKNQLLIQYQRDEDAAIANLDSMKAKLKQLTDETAIVNFEAKYLEVVRDEKSSARLAVNIEENRKKHQAISEQYKGHQENLVKIQNEINVIDATTTVKAELIGAYTEEVVDIIATLTTANATGNATAISNYVAQVLNSIGSLAQIDAKLAQIALDFERAAAAKVEADQAVATAMQTKVAIDTAVKSLEIDYTEVIDCLNAALAQYDYADVEQVAKDVLDEASKIAIEEEISAYNRGLDEISGAIRVLNEHISGAVVSEDDWRAVQVARDIAEAEFLEANNAVISVGNNLKVIEAKLEKALELNLEAEKISKEIELLNSLFNLFKGKMFVEFIAIDKLKYIAMEASKKLFAISNGRYELALNADGGFMIKDYANGGAARDGSTLSGGETFLASLSLALALSSHIQLRGSVPLELFFLDEGFGTLDENLLDVVIGSLEQLHNDKLKVGIISHMAAIKSRVPAKLILASSTAGNVNATISLD
ncbi:AAA family ATPase [Candidatus Epulonipiscium viviparus]|uniref:AAA family ATPase n=1 Tax=Candidatus Epulonipiscium viviparus TaxID=420336 RepID=UPI0027380C8A|nr:AAA family ATPase [Candidatus Epulopiscium viviparus]